MANTLGSFTKIDNGAFTGTFKTLNVNASLAAPEFGPYAIYCRLVKLKQPGEDGATHMILWEPRDR